MTQLESIATWRQVFDHAALKVTQWLRWHLWLLSGTTSIPHDSELETDVGHCSQPGCYSKKINYDASDKQMAALAELSVECHQSIKVEYILISNGIQVLLILKSFLKYWNISTIASALR